MDAQAHKPIISIALRQGETIGLPNGGEVLHEVTCDAIAKMALAMCGHSLFFLRRRGLSISFSRDLNGSGTQGLYIARATDEMRPPPLIAVVFSPTYNPDGEFLYEADLITDGRKDYEPSVNRGKHRFAADSATMQIDWFGEETTQWRSDIDRLSTVPENLAGWIDANLEMMVRCDAFFCEGSSVLTKSDLSRYVAAGLGLEDLKTRLQCSRCGERRARVMVF